MLATYEKTGQLAAGAGVCWGLEIHDKTGLQIRERLAERRDIEAADTIDFETFRQQYLSQDLLSSIRLELSA